MGRRQRALAMTVVGIVHARPPRVSVSSPLLLLLLLDGLGPGRNARSNQIRKDHRAATDAALVHPVVLPLQNLVGAAVHDAEAGRAHFTREDGSSSGVSADGVGGVFGCHWAGAENGSAGVAASVADQLGKAHFVFFLEGAETFVGLMLEETLGKMLGLA